ncbi:retrovirus-related Pol polyprotein from transposon 17.6 [Trichonephila clavipes]|nr:retrovirus-related Pol polyprotein from transposon 17.6 [Trichonephila clavipes]
MKLNQIASEERSGLSSAQTENPVLSALADRLQEINLRVGRLQEASAVTARKSGGNYFNRRENVFKCFYCGIQGHRQAECRKRQRDERAARYQPPGEMPQAGLDNKIKNRLFQLLISHKSAFARSTVELSAAVTEHHRISLQHDYPIKCPIYKIPFNLRNEFRRQIADLEKAGIISKSNSQYNTPALFVKQKEKWRLVLDFRKLNEITVTQDFVIPTLDDILHEISGSNYFSALDMKSAFNQIPLHFADRHKTAFSTPDGDKYQFNRLCFGLKNSPKAFQSIAQEVLGDLLHHGALVYIDDIILFTKTIDEHFELLGKVFERFERIRLKFNPSKCQFLTKSCKFLGFVVTPEGILIDKDKSVSINEFPVPKDQKQIKFFRCCNFYRRYIKNFAKRALPLTNLLRKDTPFEWTSETQEAFDDIKKAILNPPVLALPDQNAELQITTDASSRGIGAVLEQKYPNSEAENLKFLPIIKPLAGFLSNKNPSSKILRWKLALEEFNYDIHYIRGSLNSVADHLSRYINNITIALPDSKDLINMQREDSVLSTIIQKIDQNDVSPQISNYFINGEGLLCHLSKRPSRSPRSNTTRKQSHGYSKRHISSYSAHVNGRVEKPNQSLANILASISQNTNDWDDQLPHTMLALNSAIHEATYTSPFFLEHGRDIRLSYTYEKNSDTPQNKYEYVEKLLPSLEHTFNKVLKNLKDQEASHVELSTRATKQHHYDYKIGSLCFIKTPNIKSNLSPKLRPKFEGPYRVIERFSNVNYRVQHVEQLRRRFNTHVNRMIPFIKRFSYLHLKNLDDLQPDETEVKGIVPSPRYNLRARAGHSAR